MRLLPVEYLPDDYKGPNAGTEKEIIGNNSKTFFVALSLYPFTYSVNITVGLLYVLRGRWI